MSRWSGPAECYLVNALCEPVAGPFSRNAPVVAIVDRLYREHGKNYYYGSATRYQLGKDGAFPRSKAGDARLKAAVAHPDLEELLLPLLGRMTATRGGGYDSADWPAIDALLSARGSGKPPAGSPTR